MSNKEELRPVIITTKWRGVFFGYAADTNGKQITLKRARMAIYWGTTKGLFQLAESGPTEKSRISAMADEILLRGITAVIEVSQEAVEKWEKT